MPFQSLSEDQQKANKIDKSYVALTSSRGLETIAHKMFMRVSAILPFYLIYIPTLVYLISGKSVMHSVFALFYPGLLVIDNGHFQYNSVSLGLFLAMILCLFRNRVYLGSVFFVAALNYKQMELYHALPVFVFILSKSVNKTEPMQSLIKIIKIGMVVICSFILLWLPFIATGTIQDVLIRIFPFNRGIYEDKVASFWCAFSVVLKRLPIQNIQIHISTAMVLLSSSVSLVRLFLKPSTRNFKLTLVTTSLSFFLFSFHVHEKTILLAVIPAILLLPEYPEHVLWMLNISNISLFDLCLKDNSTSFVFFFFFYFLVSFSFVKNSGKTSKIHFVSVLLGFFLCASQLYGPRIPRFPHLYQLGNAFYCCIHFIYFLIFFTLESFRKV
uniref:Alpha-1,3-glucosyltransferase n=1 Tax=Caenorhabditis japonica TaxID=281687 RepID=A0A8R1HLM1_CAEJA